MKTMGLRISGAAGVVAMALLSAAAGAQCLSGSWRGGSSNGPKMNTHQAVTGARLISAAYREDDDDQGDGRASIVGMWHVHLVAQSVVNLPPQLAGLEIDAGYQQWHSDKTELLNSGGRGPATGSFCMGVWEQTGRRTFQLNHFAIAWAQGPAPDANSAPTNTRTGPSSIVETVTVSPDGKTFTGTFTITDYTETDSPSGSTISFSDSITGTISATRIDVNTPASPIF